MRISMIQVFVCVLAISSMAFGQNEYRCVDENLRLDVIHSDPEAFYISMDMDTRGNLYVGGRDAVYLFEADDKGRFKARRTITKLPNDTWAYSLQVVGDDLYVLTVTALYRLPGVIRNPKNVTFERLVWGIPLGHIHQGFHGMKMGPDGCLNLAFGDPHPGPFRSKTNPGHVWHWTFLSGPNAKKMPWTGVGGVIRYDPKSHDLHVVSRGHRNICDLAIDEHWNLFGNDNDQEGSPLHTLGRLTHVTEGSHYQWSRGWLEVTEPHRNDLIKTIVPDLGRFVPFGTCYYNEAHLGESYKRSLFVARWGSRELGQFPLQERGASFASSQKTLVAGKGTARPVAVFTGNDGRLFMSVCFMERNEASPVKRTDLVMISNPKRPRKSHAYEASSAGVDHLLAEIESSSWKRRFNAHREILARGLAEEDEVVEGFLKCAATDPAWHSLAWLAGRSKNARVTAALNEALKSSDARVVAAAADILNRFHQLDKNQIKNLLVHQSPVVQLAGLRNLASDNRDDFIKTIDVLSSNEDSHVRQLAMRMLGQARSFEQLEQQFNYGDLPARRVAMSAAMWKWIDTVENGTLPSKAKLGPAQDKHLRGFKYVDDSNSDLLTESKKHGFSVGGLSLMDWWRQTSASNTAAPILQRMITKAIDDEDDAHRKTAAVFANTLGMNELAARVPGLMQTRSAKAKLVKGAKLSANKAMPAEYQKVNWSKAWKDGKAGVGAKLFKQRCVACHDAGKGGGVIGPSLAGIANRFKPQYLAESVAVPSKDISPNFQAWSITLKHVESFEDDLVLLGMLSGENDKKLTLQLLDGTLKAINKTNIKNKSVSQTSLMPVGLITGPDELKHILRYLMTLNAPVPTSNKTNDDGTSVNLLADGDLKKHFQTTGNWALSKDGVAHLQPRVGETDWKRYGDYLWLKQQYKNFECEFEYKHEKGGNSGFYFNVTDRQQAVGSVIEVQIRDSAGESKLSAHGTTGGILPGGNPIANTAKPAGQWNRMKVKSLNGEVTVTLNGEVVNKTKLTHSKLKSKPKQGFIGFQDHGIPFWLRNIHIRSLSSLPTIPKVDADSLAVNVACSINPTIANEFRFATIEARFVRVKVLESNGGQPCIDELEIFSPGLKRNIALQSNGAKATASSLLKGYSKHKIEHLNDGQYGNLRSWIPAEKTGWAQIELAKATEINRVVLSRDRGGKLTRRNPIAFDILVSNDGKEWKTVKKVRPRKAATLAPKRAPKAKPTPAAKPALVPAKVIEDGFTSIFDGKNLDQWDYRKGAWELVDGTISCTGVEKTRNWIIWRGGKPSDFVLRLDFKYGAGNSGVQVRSDDQGDHQVFGYQVEIAEQDKMGLWHHSLLPKDDPAREARHLMATAGQEVAIDADGKKTVKQVAAKEKIVAHFRPNGWNSMGIIAEGNTLTQKINGVVFSKVTDDDKRMSRRKGVIALQDHGKGCQVAFRNIRIKKLASDGEESSNKAPTPAPEPGGSTAKLTKPNIVVIMADDFGWGDTSSNSPESPIRTPHIDRIAKEGIRLANAHAPAAACTPTRYGLLTGRYPWRSYVKKGVLKYYAPAMITKDHVTIPSFLKTHNYRTAGFGKWHTGLDWTPVKGDPVNWRSHWNSDARNANVIVGKGIDHSKPFGNAPTDIGFDTYFGSPSNAGRLPFFIEDNHVAGNPKRDEKGLMRDPNMARDKVDDIYVSKAISFITAHQKDHAERPFFVYLPLNAIHGAVEVPGRFKGKTKMSIREDKIHWVNESVGKMLDALDDLNLAEDTLVVFTSDNGPLNSPIARENGHQPTGPYRGYKSNVYEGGTRVPFLARWPGRISAGANSDQLACLTDVLATVADLCGAPLHKEDNPDSVSLLPVLLQKNKDPVRDNLVTLSFGGYLTMQKGQWKAAFGTKWTGGFHSSKYGGTPPEGIPKNSPEIGQLFDISKDPFEKTDVWEKHPAVVKTLRKELERIRGLAEDDPKTW